MGNLLIYGLALSLLLVTSGPVSAQPKDVTAATQQDERLRLPRQAAETGLVTMRRAAAGEGARLLGFRSGDEPTQATLGEPFPIGVVRLDALQAYDASRDAPPIIIDNTRMLFPVQIGSETRTGIEVIERRGKWDASAIGGSRVAYLLDSARVAHRGAAGSAAASYFALHVPALNVYFLGVQNAGDQQLIALSDDPRFPSLRPGAATRAADVLAALVSAARSIDPKQSS